MERLGCSKVLERECWVLQSGFHRTTPAPRAAHLRHGHVVPALLEVVPGHPEEPVPGPVADVQLPLELREPRRIGYDVSASSQVKREIPENRNEARHPD